MLIQIGVTYREVTVDALSRLETDPAALAHTLVLSPAIDGALPLSTCNRFELYVDAPAYHPAIDAIHAAIGAVDPGSALRENQADRLEQPAVQHLFEVASGLDAMVLGEAEVSGQLSEALEGSRTAGTLTPLLERLAQAALRCSKDVATQTELGEAGRSTVGVALDRMENMVPAWSECDTLIVGTGSIARVAAHNLRTRGVTHLSVHSPTDHADAFAARHDATIIPANDLATTAANVDLLFAGSGHARASFTDAVIDAVAHRDRPLAIIDLSVPPDIPPALAGHTNVTYFCLSDMENCEDAISAGVVAQAHTIVDAAAETFGQTEAVRHLDPAIIALRHYVDEVIAKEMTRLRGKVDPAAIEEFELSTHRIAQSILHRPMERAHASTLPAEQHDYVKALHMLFGIDIDTEPRHE